MVSLINHINKTLPEYEVIIVPNETSPLKKYNDINVGQSIANDVKEKNKVVVMSDADLNAVEIKNVIASCDVVVSARYHSCVAALSSTVPTLAMGWHYKYDELLRLYGQTECMVSGADCSPEELIRKFDHVFDNRDKIHSDLCVAFSEIEKDLVIKYKNIFISEGN